MSNDLVPRPDLAELAAKINHEHQQAEQAGRPGLFQGGRVSPFGWNTGAWFGCQIGGTAWLLLGSITMLQSPIVGLVWSCAFALANGFGLALWARRGRLGMYAAIQVFLLALAALSVASIAVADWYGLLPGQVGNQWGNPRAEAYEAMLIFPALILQFWLHERFGSRISPRPPQDLHP
jgi:hypothetical protein